MVQKEFVDTCYFPITRLLVPALDKAIS